VSVLPSRSRSAHGRYAGLNRDLAVSGGVSKTRFRLLRQRFRTGFLNGVLEELVVPDFFGTRALTRPAQIGIERYKTVSKAGSEARKRRPGRVHTDTRRGSRP